MLSDQNYTCAVPPSRKMSKKLTLKRSYERAASIEPFYTGGAICLSRDGSVMCCTCAGQVKLVDVETGAVRTTIDADADQVTALALAPNNQELVTAGRDFLVKTWDTISGEKVRSWKSGQGNSYVQRLAYDDTGTLAAGGCSDFVVRIWDAGRGFATHNLKGHGALVTSVLFGPAPRSDPNKLLLFSGAEDGEVRVWSLANKTCKAVLKVHDSAVTAMAVHVPTRSLLTGGRDRIVAVWDLRKMESVHSVPVYDTIEGLAIVPTASNNPAELLESDVASKKKKKKRSKGGEDEESASVQPAPEPVFEDATSIKDIEFVTAGEKGTMKRWKVGTGTCIASEPERSGAAAYATLLQDSTRRKLLGVTVDNALLFFNPSSLSLTKQMVGHNEEVLDVVFAGESMLGVCTNSDHLRLFNTETQSCQLLHGHTNVILGVDCAPGSGLITTVSKDRLVRTWHVASAKCVGIGEGHVDAIGAVAVGPRHGQVACTGSSDLTIKVWDLKPAQQAAAVIEAGEAEAEAVALVCQKTWKAHDKDINSVAISPNDGLVASGSQDKKVKIWDIRTGELKTTCAGHKRGVWCVKMSPVDKVVASSSADGTVKVWSVTNGACLKTMEGHDGSVLKLAFVCSGMQLLSTGSDGLLKLWTIKTSVCVNTFDHHTDKVWALAVAPSDDTMVVTGGADSVINVWEDRTADLEEEARKESEEKLLLEQDLSNALRNKDYRRAAMLAFELKQPFRLLRVVQEMLQIGEDTELNSLVASFNPEQVGICLGYVRDWNTTARNAQAAQAVLLAMLKAFSVEQLCKSEGIKEIVDALIPYTERHFERLEEALQRTYTLDLTLHAMRDVLGTDDGFDDDAEMFEWTIDTKGSHAARFEEIEEGGGDAKVKGAVAEEEGGEEEDGEMQGWGSWGGPTEDDDGAWADVEEEEEEDAGKKKSKKESKTQGKKKVEAEVVELEDDEEAMASEEEAEEEEEEEERPARKGKKGVETPKGKKAEPAAKRAATTGKKKLKRAAEEEDAEEEEEGAAQKKAKRRVSMSAVSSTKMQEDEDEDEEEEERPARKGKKGALETPKGKKAEPAAKRAATTGKKKLKRAAEEEEDAEEEEEEGGAKKAQRRVSMSAVESGKRSKEPKSPGGTPPKKSPVAGRTRAGKGKGVASAKK